MAKKALGEVIQTLGERNVPVRLERTYTGEYEARIGNAVIGWKDRGIFEREADVAEWLWNMAVKHYPKEMEGAK